MVEPARPNADVLEFAVAFSRVSRSSRRTRGVRMIEPARPARIRECTPIIAFSVAVMVENRRMFWNVRAIPAFITMSGGRR